MIQYYVKPEAEGVYNGRKYKGMVIATDGTFKAVSRTYTPDVFNENLGRAIALKRFKIKVAREQEKELTEYYDRLEHAWNTIAREMNSIANKIINKVNRQQELRCELFDLFEEVDA